MGSPRRLGSSAGVALSAALLLGWSVGARPAAAAPGDPVRVSEASDGTEADAESLNASVSADGRYVAFDSPASNLAGLDLNGAFDVFVRDRSSGSLTRVSVSTAEGEANGDSFSNFSSAPVVSSDGSVVVFSSTATNLVGGDTNGAADVFVRDQADGTTSRASTGPGGSESDGPSDDPAVSADGRYVGFDSTAADLVASDTNGVRDVFVHDRDTGSTQRVSIGSGTQADGPSSFAALSGDGRYVAFESRATNLTGGDSNGVSDVFVRDRTSGTTVRASVSSAAAQGDAGSFNPTISSDGRYVAFESAATTLVANDTNGTSDVFVRDLVAGTTARASVGSAGEQSDGDSVLPAIAPDGGSVAFCSDATTLVPNDGNDVTDVFVRMLASGQTVRASLPPAGEADGGSFGPALASGAALVAFESSAANLVAGDGNEATDVFAVAPDTMAPGSPQITAPSEGERTNDAPVAVSGAAEPGSIVRVIEGGGVIAQTTAASGGAGLWSVSIPFAEGSHSVTARAVDRAGNLGQASAARSFVVDRTAPSAPAITSPSEGQTTSASPVTVAGTAEPGAAVRVLEGGAERGTAQANGAGAWSVGISFPDGAHTIVARATDAAGNQGTASPPRSFVVDRTGPAAPVIASPAEGAATNAAPVPVSGTAEPNATVRVAENGTDLGQAVASASGAWSVSIAFGEGPHTIVGRATDALGNTGPPSAARSFVVDRTAPGPPVVATPAEGATVPAGSVTIGGTSEPGSTIAVREGAASLGIATADGSGSWSLAATITAKGTHSITATQTDRAGNLGGTSPPRTFSVTTAIPVIAAPAEGSFTNASPVLVTGTAEAGARVDLYRAGALAGSDVAEGGAWSISLSLGEGAHSVTAVAVAGGMESPPSAARAFTVDRTAPAAPAIANPAAGATLPGTAVTIEGTAEPHAAVTVTEGAAPLGVAQASAGGAWTLTVQLAPGSHTVRAAATDRAGNTGPASAERAFSIAPGAAIVAPAEGSVQPGSVAFEGSAHATATEIRLYEGEGEIARAPAAGGAWSVQASLGHGVHHVTVRAVTGGVLGPPSPVRTFTVDATPPQVSFDSRDALTIVLPTGTLAGTAEDRGSFDTGVARVVLTYRDAIGGALVAEVEATCAACPSGSIRWDHDPGVLPGSYSVTARAYDLVGNSSARTLAVLILG